MLSLFRKVSHPCTRISLVLLTFRFTNMTVDQAYSAVMARQGLEEVSQPIKQDSNMLC